MSPEPGLMSRPPLSSRALSPLATVPLVVLIKGSPGYKGAHSTVPYYSRCDYWGLIRLFPNSVVLCVHKGAHSKARRGYSSPCLLVRVLCSLSTASLCHHPYPLVIISGSRYTGLSQGHPKTGIHALTRIRDRAYLPYAGTSMPEVLTSEIGRAHV